MEKMIENGQMSVATSANEKVVKYVNNNHCKGTKAIYKVESHKYASDTHRCHSVWVDYYYDIRQLKNCFHHNDYMDAEKLYVKVGSSWRECDLNDELKKYDDYIKEAEKNNVCFADNAQTEDINEAAAKSENVLAYEDDIYTYNVEDNGDRKSADYETIDELINWTKKFPYKWFKVNNNDRLSFQFRRETYDDGGHQYRLYMHDNYGVLGDNNWYICNRITYNKAYKLMGKIMDCMFNANDNMPQTEDFYFKTEEYKKAEAEAVKALPF